jgi:hypothetical protein
MVVVWEYGGGGGGGISPVAKVKAFVARSNEA